MCPQRYMSLRFLLSAVLSVHSMTLTTGISVKRNQQITGSRGSVVSHLNRPQCLPPPSETLRECSQTSAMLYRILRAVAIAGWSRRVTLMIIGAALRPS